MKQCIIIFIPDLLQIKGENKCSLSRTQLQTEVHRVGIDVGVKAQKYEKI